MKGEFAHKGEYMRAKDPRFTQCGATTRKLWEEGKFEPWKKNYNKLKQRYSRRWITDEQVEYYMIADLLNTRRNRQLRSGKEHLLDNLAATKGMRALKEFGRKRDFMRRKARDKDEEVVWQIYWERGEKYKTWLNMAKPEFANLFREKEENAKKRKEEQERIEKELDEQGRWNYDNCSSEYIWSIPDESGHHMTLAEYNKEDEEEPITIEEQLQRARTMRDPEERAK